jgi:hypothetical protein
VFYTIKIKIVLDVELSQFYQLQTLLMLAALFKKEKRLQVLRHDRFLNLFLIIIKETAANELQKKIFRGIFMLAWE